VIPGAFSAKAISDKIADASRPVNTIRFFHIVSSLISVVDS
jgi:hypothetical protein